MSDGAGKYRRLLDEAIENLSQYFFDSYGHDNAEFRTRSGLSMIVIREELGDCCSWCADLAGTYDYADAPKEVWQRHANCRCMVITRTEKGTFQDAWSRKEYQSEREARIAREEELSKEYNETSKKQTEDNKNRVEIEKQKAYNKGAIIGALNNKNDPDGRRREAHANRYYEAVKNSNTESMVSTIANNTGIDRSSVEKMIKHVFINEYDLDGEKRTFYPDYDMAESVRRLREGKNIQEHDIILVKHEAMEYDLMNNRGMSYREAHEEAAKLYDYGRALAEWYKRK